MTNLQIKTALEKLPPKTEAHKMPRHIMLSLQQREEVFADMTAGSLIKQFKCHKIQEPTWF